MSRGGRGGGRGGFSKSGSGRVARIGGVEIAYDDGLYEQLKSRVQPAPLFPSYKAGEPKPLSRAEEDEVARFLRTRDRFRDGPLYASVGRGQNALNNPFEGMGAYSQKYIKRTRTLPQLNTKPRVIKNFPRELWSVIDPSRTVVNGISKARKPGPRPLILNPESGKLDQGDEEDMDDENAEDENQEQEQDDEYESDEEEMAGDYNAEQYFDDGGDDAGEEYEGDHGDGGDAFS